MLEIINNTKDVFPIIEVVKIGASILGGGAIGAIITWIVTDHRNKKQNVKYDISIESLFYPKSINNEITKITLSNEVSDYNYENLFIATLSFENIGNKEIENFNVDITLPKTIKIIKVDPITMDRSHKLTVTKDVNFESPNSEIDIEMRPFNRKDKYEIKLLFTIETDTIDVSDFVLSTTSPINFVSGSSGYIWNKITKTMEFTSYIP